MEALSWLLFLPQAPATSSSLRVQIWRHLRAAGAITLQNGVWVLPASDAHVQFLRQEEAELAAHGGTAWLFTAMPLDGDLVERFRSERDREYVEVVERCQGLRDELARETAAGKWTFAELEENEQDLAKLERWLAQIRARDFFAASGAEAAAAALAAGRQALTAFAQVVYAQEGILPSQGAD
ncbi:MAG: hypothetical protein H0X24_00525 [Ktedonobacterales bacterium]|nr:hypothetical protein [Ktedonobacterales bacterium]